MTLANNASFAKNIGSGGNPIKLSRPPGTSGEFQWRSKSTSPKEPA